MTNLDSILKSRDITLPTKVCLVKDMVFPMIMYGCESWTVKKAECQRIDAFFFFCSVLFLFFFKLYIIVLVLPNIKMNPHVVLEKTLESSLDCKEIQPVHSKDQSWVFIGRTDAKAETPIVWSPHTKSSLIGKDPDAGRDWGQEEKGTTVDEMAGWHY